jgi:hypothetical protein
MPNVQVTHDATVNDARSESSLVIDPQDPLRMVAASKKFVNIHTYDFTLATAYSTDGGRTWHDSAALAMPGFTVMTDPTMAWDDAGNVFLVGLAGTNPPTWNTLGIVIYKSTDGGKTWSAPQTIHTSSGDDKQWAAGDGNPASPHHGNVYAVWDETTAGGLSFARTTDHGATWIGAGAAAAGSLISTGSIYPEIDVSADGTVYIVTIAGGEIRMIVSKDGGDTFQPTPPPATGITTLEATLQHVGGFPVFPGGTFRVITDPTACAFGTTVVVAWADRREGASRIYYARSLNGGATWTTGPSGQPLLSGALPANVQHFHPQIVADSNGVLGCSFYEFGPKPSTPMIDVIMAQSFDGGSSFLPFTVTDQPWDPAVDAPWSHGNSAVTFIGDYMGLDASALGFYPLWTDTRTGIQELFTAIVPERRCTFIVNRSTLGEDEVDARRKQSGGASAVITDAFRVVVDGLTAAQVGASGPSSVLSVASPAAGMAVHCTGNASATGSYGPEPQRFTFLYDVDFGSDPADPAFAFAGATELLTLHAAVAGLSASAEIELVKQPDPFMLHGDPSWLSIDLRVFVMRPGESKFGVPMGADATAAPAFIQQVAKSLSDGSGSAGGQSFDDPNVLSPDEERSALYLHPTDDHDEKVFNFALARVRYIGLIGATDVRVFFRLFNAQTTSGVYDFPPGERYRRAPANPAGQPIPLPGVLGAEYVTIPFFALPRVDSTVVSMAQQVDSRVDGSGTAFGNVQRITARSDGSEVDTFFGCWLDVNQPTKADGTPNPVLPAQASGSLDGPFTDPTNPPLPIAQAVLRNLHQCLIAEVAFDPIAIPPGKDPSNWDKLAQRNLAWSDVGSAPAVSTFEIRATAVGLPAGQPPDELMVDWGTTPAAATATIYLPGVRADDVLAMASRLYTRHGLTRVDDHTLGCRAGGITYVPVPPGSVDYAGLLSVDMPSGLRRGAAHTVVVRQVTNASGRVRRPARRGRKRAAEASAAAASLEWRRVVGAFQLTIPVKEKALLLPAAERQLSVLRWIGEAIPHQSRWHPVFRRYLEQIARRVSAFGGDPDRIEPSPFGKTPHHGHHPPARSSERRVASTGKVAGLIFDRFGDFDGFVLDTGEGERAFRSRERELEELAERAWRERLRITVWAERDAPERPLEILVRDRPASFGP